MNYNITTTTTRTPPIQQQQQPDTTTITKNNNSRFSWLKEMFWQSSSIKSGNNDDDLPMYIYSDTRRPYQYQSSTNDFYQDPFVVDQLRRELLEARQQIKILKDQEIRLKYGSLMQHQQQQQQQKDHHGSVKGHSSSSKKKNNSNIWTVKISISSSGDSCSQGDNDLESAVHTSCTNMYLEDDDYDGEASVRSSATDFENTTLEDESRRAVGDSPSEVWYTIPFENPFLLTTDPRRKQQKYPRLDSTAQQQLLVPEEVMAIREDGLPASDGESSITIHERLLDAESRAQAFRCKLEQAEDMVDSFFRDLERARQAVYLLADKNATFDAHLSDIKFNIEDNMFRRTSFMKACIYISPIFIMFGGMEVFLCTIMLLWIFVEIDSIVNIDVDEQDG